MLTLKNITINSKTAEADYFPEAEVEASHIVVDLENARLCLCLKGKALGKCIRHTQCKR